MPTVPADKLTGLAHRVFAAAGSAEDEAALVAEHLVEANLKGHDSHGVGMIPSYLRNLNGGHAVVNQPGSCAWVACATMRASGVTPRLSASASDMSTIAAAPSEIELELAAVTVPSLRKAGLSVGMRSMFALSGCSSRSMRAVLLPAGASTATTSAPNEPSRIAACARVSDAIANRSWASRVKR